MNDQLESLLTRWDSDEGKPYKGSLFDFSSFDGDENTQPENLSCMCAQGQVLAIAGGYVPKQFRGLDQHKADKAVAHILGVSLAHSILLRNINDSADGAPSIVLRDPAKVLGDQWSKLLDFWWMLDQYSEADWRGVQAAWGAAGAAAWDAARVAARGAAWDAARVAAGGAAGGAAGDAAGEIQGFELLGERGRDVFFLPMFGIQTLGDIPARPDDYGLGFVPTGEA